MKRTGPERVAAALEALGLEGQLLHLPASTRTAAEAAQAIGCEPAQIAKSLVFRGGDSGEPLLVILSGADRVDVDRLGRLAEEPAGRADADFVRRTTGFAIGGVPPVGHVGTIRTWLDAGLRRYETVWAAAGGPHSVFRTTPDELAAATGAPWAQVAVRAKEPRPG